ncbi:MFS transporter [Inhella gelatinilytica]|uniref:MFS transporter n=1 Tax=Inhella gelatinilytica TaxID=2795030 RepID=A0A931NFF2_9BURK|nr:MFS transporter [Inhella gelatinilytica]MBH9554180.1 MFS transporter [Inhella gelatinilytica]
MATTRVTTTLWLLAQGQGEVMVGVLLALVALAPALLGAAAGAWADRYGLWKPTWMAAVLSLIGSAAPLLWPSLPTLVLGAIGTGGAIAIAAVAIQREVAQRALVQGVSSQRMYSWVALGPALSNTVSPLVAGALIDHHSHAAAFAAAVLMAPLGVLLLHAHRRDPRPPQTHRVSTRPAWDLLRLPRLLPLLLINIMLAAAWDAHAFVVPVLGHARGYSASTIGVILASFAIAAAVVRLLIIRFSGRWSAQGTLRSAMAVTAGVSLVYVWLPGVAGLMLGSTLLGLALGSVQPTILSSLTQATPSPRHGQVLGLRMLATNGASVTLPMGFGVLAGVAGVGGPLWLMAGLLLAVWPATRALAHSNGPEAS